MATNRCPLARPTSSPRSRPVSATARAWSRASGRPRLRASRLPVPAGSTPSGMPLPASPSAHAVTVPSPPLASTRSTWSASAASASPRPVSSGVVSSHSGSAQPCRAMAAPTAERNAGRFSCLVGLTITAAFTAGLPPGEPWRRAYWVAAWRRLRADESNNSRARAAQAGAAGRAGLAAARCPGPGRHGDHPARRGVHGGLRVAEPGAARRRRASRGAGEPAPGRRRARRGPGRLRVLRPVTRQPRGHRDRRRPRPGHAAPRRLAGADRRRGHPRPGHGPGRAGRGLRADHPGRPGGSGAGLRARGLAGHGGRGDRGGHARDALAGRPPGADAGRGRPGCRRRPLPGWPGRRGRRRPVLWPPGRHHAPGRARPVAVRPARREPASAARMRRAGPPDHGLRTGHRASGRLFLQRPGRTPVRPVRRRSPAAAPGGRMSTAPPFRYDGYQLDPAQNMLTCHYSLGEYRFAERVGFPGGGDWGAPAVAVAARLVFLLAGVSYYKTAAPGVIDLGDTAVTGAERAFLAGFYLDGLGEFGYRNGLDLSGL